MVTVRSLSIVTVTLADFVGSAWLVAVTCTVTGFGKSAGAVYNPPGLMVPTVEFPPETPFTLQFTAVSFVFFTLAVNVTMFPSTTDPLGGTTDTVIAGGGGGCCTNPAPPPHPFAQIPAVRSPKATILVFAHGQFVFRERGHMPSEIAGEGPAKTTRCAPGLKCPKWPQVRALSFYYQ